MHTVKLAHDTVNYRPDLCTGCARCVCACPTSAIRVRKGRNIRMVEKCIECGECIRTCPTGALYTIPSEMSYMESELFYVAVLSPVLYAQFPDVMPGVVQQALKRMGFHHTIDLSCHMEMFQFAVEEFLERTRHADEIPRPVISPVCPVVVRLIAFRFPGLLPHVLPLKRPIALMASEVRKAVSTLHDIAPDRIHTVFIGPCNAKSVSNHAFATGKKHYADKFVGINSIYPKLLKQIQAAARSPFGFPSEDGTAGVSGRTHQWGLCGGEIGGMRIDETMAISGLRECMRYLAKIELGLFPHMEYIELRTCPEGCIGGPLTIADRYEAKSTVQRMVKMFGFGRRLPREEIRQRYRTGWFFREERMAELTRYFGKLNPPLSIEALTRIEELQATIGGHDCAACGAPDCRTFAEDVVRGQARLEECLMIENNQPVSGKQKGNTSGNDNCQPTD